MTTASTIQLTHYGQQSMQKGSLSFSFASRIFAKKIRSRVVRLYAWCRYVDNRVDGLPPAASLEQRQRLLAELGEESFQMPPPALLHPAMAAFRDVRQEVKFPEDHARDLIQGMAMDLDQVQYQSEEQLLLYCYRVAGVVGLMMSHMMGAASEAAHTHAVNLGIAMQLTNISRDIAEDAAMGRIYLPRVWLEKAGIPEGANIMHPVYRPALIAVVDRTLRLADRYYQSGDAGLQYLPLRCALAVAIAREVYAAIGDEVRRKQGQAWDQRVWIPWSRKLRVALRGVGRVTKTVPYRLHLTLQSLRTQERMALHE
ncbi:MAG TPA: phytoene/squalene synthase family protein [Oligoflexus sp.]|uniref:phytoene/squalene synthase family protein n=1 Tax=Oligoflexus sp. TaxID=1971216 RepID=UPI002D6957B8|nr:phytoene/squalene synthase family protein [Oligoflexus sp.]HYX39724.1 phytoene/squalene synthase family protein [Oligoflexus sp.]